MYAHNLALNINAYNYLLGRQNQKNVGIAIAFHSAKNVLVPNSD